MTDEEKRIQSLRWFKRHSRENLCPPCAGLIRPNRLEDHVVRCTNLCPKCKKIWIYEIDIAKKVKDRKPRWWYSKIQF